MHITCTMYAYDEDSGFGDAAPARWAPPEYFWQDEGDAVKGNGGIWFWRRTGRPRKWRLMDPWFYFRAVVVIVLTGFIGLPFLADGVNAVKLQESSGGCRIVQVIDGDSIRLWCPGRGLQSARIRGFDAPEVFSPRCREELWRGTRAAWALRGMMMAADGLGVVRDGTDPDGQALVFMSLDGVPVARKMIGAGHARPYDGGQRASWCW